MVSSMLSDMINGLVIGVSMLIPGVSGGTVALICGIYYKLIVAVDTFFEKPRENIKFLASVAIGGVIGILAFSKLILFVYNTYKTPMVYLFMGSVLGSIPLLCKSAGIKRLNLKAIIYPMLGLLVVLLLECIPKDTFVINADGLAEYLVIFLVGIVLATALVLPGISFSYMLLILGLYEQTLRAVETVNIAYLFSMGLGVLVGVFLTAKVIRIILRKYPKQTYLVIIGFVIASLKDVFPGLPSGNELLISALLLFGSFYAIFKVSNK